MIHRFRCKQSSHLKYAMIKLKPGFHMIATIAAIAKKKKKLQRSQRSYEATLQRSQRQWSLRYKKFYLSDCCRCDRWRMVSIWSLNFFFSANTAIIVIIWKPGLIYHNSPNSWHKFQICCTNMYSIRFLPNFAAFLSVYLWISWDFVDLPEFCSSATVLNIRSREYYSYIQMKEISQLTSCTEEGKIAHRQVECH